MSRILQKCLLLVVVAAYNRAVSGYVDPYPLNQCPLDKLLIITYNTGDYPEEITWKLLTEDGAYLVAGPIERTAGGNKGTGYDDEKPYAIYKEYVCLKGLPFAQNYTLKIMASDEWFDAFSCSSECIPSGKEEGRKKRLNPNEKYSGEYVGCDAETCGTYTLTLGDGTLLASGEKTTLRSLDTEGDGVGRVQFTTGSNVGLDPEDDISYDCFKERMRKAAKEPRDDDDQGCCLFPPCDPPCDDADDDDWYYGSSCPVETATETTSRNLYALGVGFIRRGMSAVLHPFYGEQETVQFTMDTDGDGDDDDDAPYTQTLDGDDDRRALAATDEGVPAARRETKTKTNKKNTYQKRNSPQCTQAQTQTYNQISSDSCVEEGPCNDESTPYKIGGQKKKKCKVLEKKLKQFINTDTSRKKGKRKSRKLKKILQKECKKKVAGTMMRVWDHCPRTCSTIGKGKCSSADLM